MSTIFWRSLKRDKEASQPPWLILRSKFRGSQSIADPDLNSNQGKDSAGVSINLKKLGSEGACPGDRKVNPQEEFNTKRLVPEHRSRDALACH